MKLAPLTEREHIVLGTMCDFIDKHGRSPVYADLLDAAQVKTTNSVSKSLKGLKGKGWLDFSGKGKARSYQPLFYPDGTAFPTREELISVLAITRAQRAQLTDLQTGNSL